MGTYYHRVNECSLAGGQGEQLRRDEVIFLKILSGKLTIQHISEQ